MKEKKKFKIITHDIKKECLSFGYGYIKLEKDKDDLWIDDYENYLYASVHADAITIDYDVITICEDGQSIITFDDVYSIDRQIQIYETIFDNQDQLHFYELDWNHYFKAMRVKSEEGLFVWRILTSDESRHLWYNGKKCELFRLSSDGTGGIIDEEERLNECLNEGYDIGVAVY